MKRTEPSIMASKTLGGGPNTVFTKAYVLHVPFSWVEGKKEFREVISYPKAKKDIKEACAWSTESRDQVCSGN